MAYSEDAALGPRWSGWRMAGAGGFRPVAGEAIESYGGPGLLWFAKETYENFVLRVEWRVTRGDDNSGVFIRCPPLANDPTPAIERGYEVQIDDWGYAPKAGQFFSPLHLTGAIYRLAPARILTSRGAALWNTFEISARSDAIEVVLNGEPVSKLARPSREPRGHVALQAHHEGSHVQFRNLTVRAEE
jgi:Domain of Unknown Function (DUF1080)